MTDSVRLGRILGIPIGLHWGALIVGVLFTLDLSFRALPLLAADTGRELRLGLGVIGALLFFISILAHELGHSLVALRHGIGVNGVTLWLMGGVARLDRAAPSARAEFQVAVAGPATSAALAVLFAAVAVILDAAIDAPALLVVVGWLAAVNAVLAVFNLLPGAPLDGGRVLTALLWRSSGDPLRARLVAGRCGLVLGVALTLGGIYLAVSVVGPVGLFNAAVGLMVAVAAGTEIRSAVIEQRLTTPLHQLHLRYPPSVSDHLTLARYDELHPSINGELAHPVVRWGREPIGYIGPDAAAVTGPQRSWTTVAEVMHDRLDVLHVPSDLTAGRLLELWDADDQPVTVAVTVDRQGRPVGTVTDRRLAPLVARPSLWGRDRDPLPPTSEPAALAGSPGRP